MDNPDITALEEELKGEGLKGEEISQCIEIIKDIYIGQNISYENVSENIRTPIWMPKGILQSDFDGFDTKPFGSLLNRNYIERDLYHGQHLYCTTEKGSEIGKIVVTNLIDENKGNIEKFLSELPQKVLNFIFQEETLKEGFSRFIYPVDANDIRDYNWKDHIRKSNKIHRVWTSVLMKLEEFGLCIITNSYVGKKSHDKSKGIREQCYVVSPEVFEFLVELCPQEALTLTDKDYENLKLYDVLAHFTHRGDCHRDDLRNKLTEAKLEKEKIREVIGKMADLRITSKYRGLTSEAPFSIKDEIRYEDWLEKNLIEPVIGALLEQPTRVKEKDEAIKEEKREEVLEVEIASELPKESIIIGSEGESKQWGIIGKLGGNNVMMDLNAPHIIFVCGKMGYGKGYVIGVLCEMLASHSIEHISRVLKKATIIIFHKPRDDVRSEFWSVVYPNDVESEIKSLKAYYDASPSKLFGEKDFRVFLAPNVYENVNEKFEREYKTKNVFPLSLEPSKLSADDWGIALSTGSSDSLYIKKLFNILGKLQYREFTVDELKNNIRSSELNKTQKELAIMRIELIEDFLKYGDFMENIAIGGINVIDFRKLMKTPDDIFAIMTLILSVIQSKKGFEDEPFVFVINEAHDYFRKGISKEFVDKIEHLIRRKRHGANWLLLDTHKPDDVSSNVVEFSDVKIIHRMDTLALKHLRDINTLTKKAEKSPDKLEIGEAIIVADESSEGKVVPILVRIRPRITEHGGATKTAV